MHTRSCAAVITCWLIVAPVLDVRDCSAQVVGVGVSNLSKSEQSIAEDFIAPKVQSLSLEAVSKRIDSALMSKSPLLIVTAMKGAADWIQAGPGGPEQRARRSAAMRPLIERALSDTEPFTRMGGALALLESGEVDRLKRELAKDSGFLLFRPQPDSPISERGKDLKQEVDRENLIVRLGVILGSSRDKLIDATGRLGVREARKNLEAIANDPHGDFLGHPGQAARRAIARIDAAATIEDGGDFERRTTERSPEPVFKLKGTPAKTVGTPVSAPTPEELSLLTRINDAVNRRVSAEELIRSCDAAINTKNPQVMLDVISLAARWAINAGPAQLGRDRRVDLLRPLVDRCLTSNVPFQRMAGAYFLLMVNEDEWLRAELSKDSKFLLLRPEGILPSSQPTDSETRVSREFSGSAITVTGYRDQLLRGVTRLKIEACRENLEAIVLDPKSKDLGLSGYEAKQALAALDEAASGAKP